MAKTEKRGIMRQKGYTPVGVPNELVELIDMVCKEKKGFVSRQDFVRSAIMNQLDRLGYYATQPRMEIQHVNLSENFIMLKDNKLHTYASISFHNRVLFCEHCHSSDCEHVKVARSLPDVQKLAKDKGFSL